MITINYLNSLLMALLGSEELVVLWWESPNRAFADLAPVDVDLYLVCEYLEAHCYGCY